MEDDTLFSLFILTGLLAIYISGYNLTIAWRKNMPVWKRVVLVRPKVGI
ncbi:hypothetical protein M3650_16185 [Paenibacillus sp. MER TA 81-3]|nr:hypothetical protein [Paenibacillus sp. MER TA 81-3]MCM3340135.1 hypothetical protein [Paenibacillus sp. MER TA 81-3]